MAATRTTTVPFRGRKKAAIVISGTYASGVTYAIKGRRWSPAAAAVVSYTMVSGSLGASATGSFVVEAETYDELAIDVTIQTNEGPAYVDVETSGDEGAGH